MTDQNNNSPPNGPPSRRRSSFAGQAFADLFGGNRNRSSTAESSTSPPGSFAGPITTAAAQANQRRLSLATAGLANSPPQGGSFYGNRTRGDSVSSSNNASVDESAIDDEPASASGSQPNTPFARRVSFGARALRDMNKPGGNGSGGNNGSNGRVSTSTIPEEYTDALESAGGGGGGKNGRSSPIDVAGSASITVPTIAKGRGLSSSSTASTAGKSYASPFAAYHRGADVLTIHDRTGESGFNWADNMRSRAERTSIGGNNLGTSPTSYGTHHRAKSVAVMEQPIREAPKPARVLDHTQERILKGDFYMD